MRIKSREPITDDGDRERLTIVPESLDDLWHLQYVLEPSDRLSGETTRRIRQDDDMIRDTGGERESIHVTIDISAVEFHKFANRLRVSGEISASSREDQLGHQHTINVEVYDEITIEKSWKPDQLARLEEAEDAGKQPDVAIAMIEEGAAQIFTVSQSGVDEYASFSGSTGKDERARSRTTLFEELSEGLSYLEVDAIILAGPGFTKEDAKDVIEADHPEIIDRLMVVDTSTAGNRGVQEVLKRGAVEEVLTESRIAEEARLIEELMDRIRTGETAVYGPDATYEAATFGAVEVLLIVDERLRVERGGEGEWDIDVNELVQIVEEKGGEITVFSSEFEPGQQLRGLGGVGALLRYRIT